MKKKTAEALFRSLAIAAAVAVTLDSHGNYCEYQRLLNHLLPEDEIIEDDSDETDGAEDEA